MSKAFLVLALAFAENEGQRFVQRARDRSRTSATPTGGVIASHRSGSRLSITDPERVRPWRTTPRRSASYATLQLVCWRAIPSPRLPPASTSTGVLSPRDWYRAKSGKTIKGSRWTVDNLKMILSNPTTQGIKTVGTDRTVVGPCWAPRGSQSEWDRHRSTPIRGTGFSRSWRSGPRIRANDGTASTRCSRWPSALVR